MLQSADAELIAFVLASALLTICGLSLLLLPRLICYWNRRPARGTGFAALQFFGWLLLLIVILMQLTRYGIGLIPLAMFIGAGLIVALLVEQKRRGQQEILLRMISSAITRRLPLAPVLASFSRDAVGWNDDAGKRMAEALYQGIALDQAMEEEGDPLGDAAGLLLRMGRETHSVGPALSLLTDTEKQMGPLWRTFIARICYLLMLLLGILGVLSFALLVIVPSLDKIFKEFSLELPIITRVVIALSHSVLSIGAALILVLPILLLYVCSRFVGHWRRDLSRTGRIGMPLHRACILESLSLAADKEMSLENATGVLAAIYPRRFVRNRLAEAHMLMQQGQDWRDSFRNASLLRDSDVAALRLARQPQHLAWTLRELAAASRRRFLQRSQAIGQIAFPIMLMGLGLAAAVVAIAMFLPLVALIHSLT